MEGGRGNCGIDVQVNNGRKFPRLLIRLRMQSRFPSLVLIVSTTVREGELSIAWYGGQMVKPTGLTKKSGLHFYLLRVYDIYRATLAKFFLRNRGLTATITKCWHSEGKGMTSLHSRLLERVSEA